MAVTLNASQVYSVARRAGASHQEAITLTAIAKGESGFRADAHNPVGRDNSYGLWQINMLGSMGVNRARQWGLKSYEELWDPRVNAKAALSILRSQGWNAWTVYSKGIYKQYLNEATAAGNATADSYQQVLHGMDWRSITSALGTGTRITANSGGAGVGEVIGGPSGGGGAVAGGGGAFAPAGLPPNATPEQIEAYIRENYPQAAGFLDIPEIRAKLIEAARGQWTGTKLQAEIQATTWWRTNGEAARQFFALKGTDPAQVKALVDAKVAEITPQLAQLGVTKGLDGKAFNTRDFAEQIIKYGWSQDEVRARLASLLQFTANREGLAQLGSVDQTADRLMQMARSEYYVPISRMDAERWAIDIFAGRKTEDTLRDYLANMAEARFPGIREQGFTPGDYMTPVRNIIAETLEMNPADVDLLDRRWSEVLQYQGADGKLRPMSLAEAERYARSRAEYQHTKGAKAEAASMAETLAKTFGAV